LTKKRNIKAEVLPDVYSERRRGRGIEAWWKLNPGEEVKYYRGK